MKYKTDIIKSYQAKVDELLNTDPMRYSDWPPDETSCIADSAGVYHFYKKSTNQIKSLYVGKAGFGRNDNWNLYERLKQHFQPSQKNALIGKVSSKMEISKDEAKRYLESGNVYLQYLVFAGRQDGISAEVLEAELCYFEHFAIAVLKPMFTD